MKKFLVLLFAVWISVSFLPSAALAADKPLNPTKRASDGNLVGDVDADKDVDAKDLQILSRRLAGWKNPGLKSEAAADIDGDHAITAIDRMLLRRYLGRWEGYERYFTAFGNAPRRALLIGQDYEEGTDSYRSGSGKIAVDGMKTMLESLSNWFAVSVQQDLTVSGMKNAIDACFKGAASDSVSLFFFSGHGGNRTGGLQGVDGSFLYLDTLAEKLAAVPGKIIVILNSCHSGHLMESGNLSGIGDETESDGLSDGMDEMEAFNRLVIQAFEKYEPSLRADRYELNGSSASSPTKFYILTSSDKEEQSYRQVGSYEYFTRGLLKGLGHEYNFNLKAYGEYNGSMPADVNKDASLTLKELYEYSTKFVKDNIAQWDLQQNVQVFGTLGEALFWR